jgi:hypothetical protein
MGNGAIVVAMGTRVERTAVISVARTNFVCKRQRCGSGHGYAQQ